MDTLVSFIARRLGSERLIRAGVWGVILLSIAAVSALATVIALVARTEPTGKSRTRSRIAPLRD